MKKKRNANNVSNDMFQVMTMEFEVGSKLWSLFVHFKDLIRGICAHNTYPKVINTYTSIQRNFNRLVKI